MERAVIAWIEGPLMFEHAVGDHQHLPHARSERDHLDLAVLSKALVEALDERVLGESVRPLLLYSTYKFGRWAQNNKTPPLIEKRGLFVVRDSTARALALLAHAFRAALA